MLKFLQVIAQHGPGVFCAHHPTLLKQGNDLIHKGAHIARPETLPDGKAVAADGLHRTGKTVRNAFGRTNERGRVEADFASRDFP